MPQVHVQLSDRAYPIEIALGLISAAGNLLRTFSKAPRAFIVADTTVAPLWAGPLAQSLTSAGFDVLTHEIPSGESNKTLAEIARIYDTLIAGGIDRQGLVVALGGGVVGDMAGFAAATVLRGVPFVQVPTTLLSMVDASVGGKTGIDHPLGKNLIGAFHQPIAVLIDPQVLRTLPPRELRSGLAECIKHEIIRDGEGFARLEQSISKALVIDVDYLAELIAHNVAIKARVVESDPLERGERAHLNFGHTFGHAIETVSNYTLAHGECVALGMVAASRMAQRLSLLDGNSVRRIESLIAAAGLPTGRMTLDIDAILKAMTFDKKARSGRIRFILPDRIGHVVIRDDVPTELIREALMTLRE